MRETFKIKVILLLWGSVEGEECSPCLRKSSLNFDLRPLWFWGLLIWNVNVFIMYMILATFEDFPKAYAQLYSH